MAAVITTRFAYWLITFDPDTADTWLTTRDALEDSPLVHSSLSLAI